MPAGQNWHKEPQYLVATGVKYELCGSLTAINAVLKDHTFTPQGKTCLVTLLTMSRENTRTGRWEFSQPLKNTALETLGYGTVSTVRNAVRDGAERGYLVATGKQAYKGGPWVYQCAQPVGVKRERVIKPGPHDGVLALVLPETHKQIMANRSALTMLVKVAAKYSGASDLEDMAADLDSAVTGQPTGDGTTRGSLKEVLTKFW